MKNDGEHWKIIALTGTLSVAISSSVLGATEISFAPDATARLQMIRDLAQQHHLLARDASGRMTVAQGKFSKVDGGGEYNKIDSSSGKGK